MNNGVAELEKAFAGRGLVFRHFANGTCEQLRYQCGRIEWERRIVPPSIGTGHRMHEVSCEVFNLIAFGSSVSELAEKLTRLPTPPHRELLDA
jgi:hypothetical protein